KNAYFKRFFNTFITIKYRAREEVYITTTLDKRENLIKNLSNNEFNIKIAYAMDFIDSLPSNATVRDFYIARTEYNYNLDFIHPIYDTKNNKKPEFIDYYNGIEFDKD